MADHTSHTACILCPIWRPDADPRTPERPPICERDRWRLDNDIADLARLHHRLTNPDPLPHDTRWYLHHGAAGHTRWQPTDPLHHLGGVGPTPARNLRPPVGGSRQPPTPARLADVDLTAPARQPHPTDHARQWPEDHTGQLSTATLLDQWVRDWRDLLWPHLHLPEPSVDALVAWLRAGAALDTVGNRLDEACDRHPAIDDMAAEIRDHRLALRRALGETDPRPEQIDGVRCRRCDLINVLVRRPGDTYRAECGNCGILYTDAEYTDWVARLGGYERSLRTPQEVADLLRTGATRDTSAAA